MTEKNSLVEEAIIQMKNLEEIIAENAKGILASTMKQEIKDLVKESLNEADEDEEEIDADMEGDDMDMEMDSDDSEEEFDDEEDMDMPEPEMDGDDETLDLTGMDSQSVVKIFSALEDGDEIEVVPDEPGKVHFKDNRTNKEYIIMTESELEDELEGAIKSTFTEEDEFDFSEYESSDEDYSDLGSEEDYSDLGSEEDYSDLFGSEEDYSSESLPEEEVIYELELEEDDDMYGHRDEKMYEEDEMYEEDDMDYMMEAKKGMKPKGYGIGKGPKFEYDGKITNAPTKKMKKADPAPYTGKPSYKFDMKSPSLKGEFKETKMFSNSKKKGEFKEASRTLGSGSNFRQGGLPKPRAHSGFNANIKESVNENELMILREKNEEYRKALNVFRTKLNEVAVFNSNLAYATRLFTEHSTSKQEKIEILKRFDNVQSLKESKNLYKVIKDELYSSKGQKINESVERTIERTIQKTPSNGSAINLIESKTYENPQFLRMKDLMSKLK